VSEPCTVVILTFNCESIVGETIMQAQKVSPRVFVVDSLSTDRTPDIVRASGSELVQRPFKNYADQRNWAIGQLGEGAGWQLHLDADEVLDDTAVASIRAVLGAGPAAQHEAYMLRRVDYFMGRRLRFSGVNPWHLRLFRNGAGHCEHRLYDQHFVARSPAGRLSGCMHDRNSVSLADWTARHNRWSDLEAAELGSGAGDGALQPRLLGDPRERTRSLKHVYYRLPGGLRSLA
jgi:glycosyltransferase involved in cell wall biosynthesis